MGGAGQVMKRIPRIKFPQRHPKSSASAMPTNEDAHLRFTSTSEVPAPPINTAMGGKASLQPKRTPVSDREIEAILTTFCFQL
ncbi:hypothetical protein PVL29_021666 [Vitis rotundifolia]|uniref:Uncharacterized protein n=1 Tax=Vitis rotundifolia TaxID=103349 RepID=A0AA38Z053_VITRO|nr:hypothetical protein PVL29_021666 [Vitis rotundifolia]